jgi:hypothetical protein
LTISKPTVFLSSAVLRVEGSGRWMREERERGVGVARVKMIESRRTLHPPGSKGERDEGSERGEGGKEEREEKRRE